MKNDIQIWCTLGPSSLNKKVINRLEESGVNMFRINLSHTDVNNIKDTVQEIQKYTTVPICIDTEGPQVRTGTFKSGAIFLEESDEIKILSDEIVGTEKEFTLRPKSLFSKLKVCDLISIDFDGALLKVQSIGLGHMFAKVVCEGMIGSNKAVTIDRGLDLPILTEKDEEAVKIINELGLKHISLSFTNKKEDIESVRELLNNEVQIISKIETKMALENLDDILTSSDGILIDRGDLSREEPINKIPLLQKEIIKRANKFHKKVFVATNFLESMVNTKKPLRSEVNDIMTTLIDGADGLVLAAETAIGKFPAECGNMVKRMIKYFDIAKGGYTINEILKNDSFLLTEPNGGELVYKMDKQHSDVEIMKMPRLKVDDLVVLDSEQIAIGTYSPLKGFMCRKELESVLSEYRMPSGVVWTMPIILQVSKIEDKAIKKGSTIALEYEQDGEVYAVLEIKDIYKIDFEKVAVKWFGTNSMEHPGVKRLYNRGNICIGGDIYLVKRKSSSIKHLEYTPQQVRTIFEHKEWSKVAGFHTRNAVHRAHEFLQMSALERYNLDGILLHPVVGPKKPLDFCPEVITESYEIVLENYYPKNKFVFGAFSSYSHYAGPREAIFTALCRKNYGCSHFIIGRDHTGVKNFYGVDDTKKLLDKIGDIGITPIFFDTVHYCSKCKEYVSKCEHPKEYFMNISGTEARQMFLDGKHPPEWFLRDKVSKMIVERIKQNKEVFVK